jgi:hypothetical protein
MTGYKFCIPSLTVDLAKVFTSALRETPFASKYTNAKSVAIPATLPATTPASSPYLHYQYAHGLEIIPHKQFLQVISYLCDISSTDAPPDSDATMHTLCSTPSQTVLAATNDDEIKYLKSEVFFFCPIITIKTLDSYIFFVSHTA